MITRRRSRSRLVALVAPVAMIATTWCAPVGAVTTRSFRITSYKDFDEGEVTGVLLSSLGEALAGYRSERIELAEAQVFSTATAADGTVYIGTGDQAQLYALDAKGGGKGPRKVAKLDGVLISALAIGADGAVYAGVLPGGKIVRVQGGVAKELCRLEGADHVWALRFDDPAGKGALHAATGPTGKLYSIDPATAKSRVEWESGERHLLALAAAPGGGLIVGSADEGIVYRVAPDGSARALHDFEADEVRAVVVQGDTIYVAVNEFEKKGGTTAAAPRPRGTRIALPAGASSSSSASPQVPARDRKGKGALYRLDADGRTEQLHALADSYFTALHLASDGTLFAASGANGRVYAVRPDRTVLTAFDLPERQVLTLAFAGAPALLGTGDAGALYKLDFAPPADAAWLSKVQDAGFPARFGKLRWSSSGGLTVETRAGNTARPDKAWSDWQPLAERRAPAGGSEGMGRITSPSARYLQIRARFQKDAVLRDVTAFYAPQNQRPRVVEITVGDDSASALSKLARAARAPGKPRSPIIKLAWRVDNPDDDELVYRVYYREESGQSFRPLGGPEPLTTTKYEWNTESIPDGNYVVKLVASDERANPKAEALEHALVSAPFLVDNQKPEVVDLKVAFPAASGVARDRGSVVTDLAFSVDGGDYQPLAPRDGVLDDASEEFTLRLPSDLAPGAHSLAVRATDAADNVAVGQASFIVK